MPRLTTNPRLAERIKRAVEQGKMIIIAQRETIRMVRPEKPDRVEFIAAEERLK